MELDMKGVMVQAYAWLLASRQTAVDTTRPIVPRRSAADEAHRNAPKFPDLVPPAVGRCWIRRS